MYRKLRHLFGRFSYTAYFYLRDFFGKNHVNVDFYSGFNNFGDVLNKFLIERLTGKKVYEIKAKYYLKENYFVVGSILDRVNKNSIVWGSGFISKESICKVVPKKILAVRGPLTRENLIRQGISCPEIYGDPALLLPLIYKPESNKKYRIGIIPHYLDKSNSWIDKISIANQDVKVIDVQTKDITGIVDEVVSCEIIISSSLHGLIVSDVYEIPSLWVEFSDRVYGSGFKFMDYFKSVNKTVDSPIRIDHETKLEDLLNHVSYSKINFDPNYLLNVCPFEIKIK